MPSLKSLTFGDSAFQYGSRVVLASAFVLSDSQNRPARAAVHWIRHLRVCVWTRQYIESAGSAGFHFTQGLIDRLAQTHFSCYWKKRRQRVRERSFCDAEEWFLLNVMWCLDMPNLVYVVLPCAFATFWEINCSRRYCVNGLMNRHWRVGSTS